ncbi:MAG: hypothetical protein KAW41_05815 [Candidatus Diapherotrites archaeon]|nr:hypothetical protein [Candidatus Diapherotrites archaeon]
MIPGGVMEFAEAYLQSLPALVMGGDVGAIVIGLILFYVGLILLNKISYYVLRVLKYVVVVAIVASAFYAVVMTFIAKMAGAEPLYVILGLIGVGVGFAGVVVALYSLYREATKNASIAKIREEKMLVYHKQLLQEEKKKLDEAKEELEEKKEELEKKSSLQNLIKKQSVLLTIITYILIAEFGVFSSVTVSAPTIEIGMIMFALFTIGVIGYTLKNYPDPKQGLLYLGAAFVFAYVMSVILGHYWVGHSLEELLSTAYFALESLVAFITGIALSLFMGSKSS